jgi:hypothetical protein
MVEQAWNRFHQADYRDEMGHTGSMLGAARYAISWSYSSELSLGLLF